MRKSIKKLSAFSLNSYHIAIISGEIFLGIGLCVFSLLLFFYLAHEMINKEFVSVDTNISLFAYSLRTPLLTQFMLLMSSFGQNICLALTALIGVIFLIKKHNKEAVLFCVVLIMGLVLNHSLKFMFHRPRPTISPLVIERSYSFPSGHAMNSFIFYGLLAYFSYHFFRNKTLTIVSSVGAVVLILLIGFSRIYLGVHYFTDVLAGYIAGFWWFITVLLVEHTLVFYKLFKKSE